MNWPLIIADISGGGGLRMPPQPPNGSVPYELYVAMGFLLSAAIATCVLFRRRIAVRNAAIIGLIVVGLITLIAIGSDFGRQAAWEQSMERYKQENPNIQRDPVTDSKDQR